ncbi:NACHT, LRR and PYD domains-containing protein 12-like isoform X9 [Labeo rohita]|uniref:NACHT, LRR and PYD domains-containing protein 12-like isoform X8 n=1 Tax=Labeo rohita TaxID=84645 RepID=UPI0021E31036|nr:NACHT, LRR and PYD domains-containing protein 12-like isoform X8 [Labeo rohita]XP_050959860.1 NACHT, LRR and PYD domains-containing protein 12-like isoform X9 [Labeo rohita]
MSLPDQESVRSGSHVFSSVSVKSDLSHEAPPDFSEKTPSSPTKSVRSGSHVFSSLSQKSDCSKDKPQNLSEKTPSSPTKRVRSGSRVFTSVSLKSDRSIFQPINFSEETPSSTKSYQGQKTTVNIGAEFTRWQTLKSQKGLKSDVELATFLLNRVQYEKLDSEFQTYRLRKEFSENRLWIFQDLENKVIVFLKNELEKLKKILQKENTQYFVQDFNEGMCSIKESALDITLYFLRDMKQDKLADTLEDELTLIHQRQLKTNLKRKYQCVFEGIAKHGDSTLLNNIYTDLYITLGGSEQVNTEHEVRQIEVAFRRADSQEIQVECTNLFEAPDQDKDIRTVLTKGVAGIGKSVSVQKFALDWAEEKENQDISFVFPLPFREMNLKEEEKQSLMSLISQFFPETKGLNLTRRNQFKVLFILDGLDECRLPLNFEGNETWRDVSSPASLDVLLTNLIKGNLLPSALIWITTRPAAASKIPPDCIDRLTEIRGFSDAQKEEYFRKRFTDENQANKIVDLVKQSKSLFIMCYIPVFCWITATVLQNILNIKKHNDLKNAKIVDASKRPQESNTEDTPKTLTQMYTHFLHFQIQQSRRKYDVSWDQGTILSLGKLAFQQLERNNLIFYDTDLEACGIDVSKASVYSGMCTQIFKEETGIIFGTMYCFVHLSIQEFIAALYAHLFLDLNNKSVFDQESTEHDNKSETLTDLLKTAVDKALESDNGHLDLFLRFLLGLSLESNRPLLRGLFTQQDSSGQSYKEIVQYIKQKLDSNLSPERSINLFHCLNELNDHTLVKEIQSQLNKGSLSSAKLSPAQWSAVAFVLLTSEEELEVFDLQKFKKSDECFFRLLEVVKTSKRALLNDCDLTDRSCSALATALISDSNLKELNMSNNNIQDSGVKQLCIGLKSIQCKLEVLRLRKCDLTGKSCSALASVLSSDSSSLKVLDLSNNDLQDSGVKLLSVGLKENHKLEKLRLAECNVTEQGYKALALALRSNPSLLIELDLTGNDPGQSGVQQLNDLLQDPNCQLKTLRLLSPAADKACQYVNGIVGKNILLLKELNLSECELGDTRVNQIAAVLQDKHCKLKTLHLCDCGLTEESCSALATVLISNPSLKELDMSNNNLQDSGVQKLQDGLEKRNCTLEKLGLSNCSITEEGYKALASALRSNPSHLIELDLTGNDPGQSGVKELSDLLQDPNCQLKTLRFLGPAADEACQYVTGIVGKNPLLLRELNLSGCELGESNVNRLAALLQDKHCKLNTLILSNCNITEEGYKALASALRSNPSHLIELDLTGNDPGQSGVKELNDLLQDPNCQLKILRFLGPAADEACQYVTGIVGKNPLLLRELNLSGCDLGDINMKRLAALLQDKHCKLNILILRGCSIKEEQCLILTSALCLNPSHLRELNLSENKLQNRGAKILCDLLKDSQCKLERLRLRCCEMTDESCSAVTSALQSTPSHLRELDLSGNQLEVENLGVLLRNPELKLEILALCGCSITEKQCLSLSSALRSNLSHLRELDLSENELKNTGVNHLCDVLKDSHCKLKTLRLGYCEITDEGCSALASALKSNPSHLRELNLSGNQLGDSGVKHLCDLLRNLQCKLEKLELGKCSITEKQCLILILGLCSNPSHLRELNLSGNQMKNSGMNHLCDILKDSHCKLERLRLRYCDMTDEGCSALTSALKSNLSHLRELDLSGNKVKNKGVKHICDILKNLDCKLERLSLNDCGITDIACLAQPLAKAKALHFLKELDLSKNKIGNSKKQLSKVLKDSNCNLSIDIEQRLFRAGLNHVGGWFTL